MDVKEFGAYLKELRILQNLSTHKLAELSGVSQSYISHVESGRKKNVPSPDILKKIAKPLDINPVILIEKAGHLSGLSDIEKERLSVNYDLQDQAQPLIDRIFKTIAKGDEFIEQVQDNINDLESKYDKHLEIDEKITPSFLRNLVDNLDWDQEWVLLLIEDLYQITKNAIREKTKIDYDLRWILLEGDQVSFNDYVLTNEDKDKVLGILNVLFNTNE